MSTDNLVPENALSVVRGSSRTLTLMVTDPANNGAALNITGAMIYFTVKKRLTDALPLIQKTGILAQEIDLIEPRAGHAEIYLVPADTQHLDPGLYVFDVWVILANGKHVPVIEPSTFEVLPTVTVLL